MTTTPTALEAARAALPPLPERDANNLRGRLWLAIHQWELADPGLIASKLADGVEDALDELLRDYAAQAVVAALAAQPQGDARPDARALLTDEDWQAIADETDTIIWSKVRQAVDARLAALSHPSPQGDARALPAEPVATWKLQFLTDVTTAAGLVEHGKRDKGLARRIGEAAMRWRFELHGHAAPIATPAAPAGDARDAARYRWMRGTLSQGEHQKLMEALETNEGEYLDADIDALMQQEPRS